MRNSNHNNIDELFREGLNSGEDPAIFNEEHWLRLKRRLDRHDRWKLAAPWLKPLMAVAALLLLAFLIRLVWPDRQERTAQPVAGNQTEQQREEQKQTEPDYAAQKQEEQKQTAQSHADQRQALDEKDQSTQAGQGLTEQTHEGRSLAEQGLPVKKQGQPKKQDQSELPKQKTAEDILSQGESRTEVASGEPAQKSVLAQSKGGEEPAGAKPGKADPARRDQPAGIADKSAIRTDSVKPAEAPAFAGGRELPSYRQTGTEDHDGSRRTRLALSVLAAPSYNGTEHLKNLQPGTDIGVLFTLGLSKKWSFSTGAVYAKKLYDASYGSSSGWMEVDADCRVLDVPLNINYAFIQGKKNTFGLGTGVSSYFMLREDYRYVDGAREDIHLVNENQHWLSVLNVQATYERKLNSRVSLQVQPFVKIPVSDIGHYRVKLESYGIAFGASWKF